MSRVAVLKGGSSLERQVSLRSGARVEDALDRLGHEAIAIDVGDDLIDRLREAQPDVAFVALHGRDGEDGTVQELLEILGLPYTGSGVLACMRSIDKVLAKHLFEEAAIPTPRVLRLQRDRVQDARRRRHAAGDRGAARLPDRGEAGDRRVGARDQVRASRRRTCRRRSWPGSPTTRACCSSATCAGRDLAVSVVEGRDGPEALPIVEAVPRDEDFYDFEARYEIGRTDFVCPADVPERSRGGRRSSRSTSTGCSGCTASRAST